jgi:peptidoglycan hydrolase CwlO-like protein
MTISDEELDNNWIPNGRRPQSTIARSFSQELMDIFRIDESVADLDEKIDQKKQNITTQASELEALEARIREMDERLRRQRGDADTPLPDALSKGSAADVNASVAALEAKKKALIQQKEQVAQGATQSSGHMPPTPSASEDGHS